MIFFLFILLLEEDAGIACIYDVFGVKDVSPVRMQSLATVLCLIRIR